MNCRCWLPLGCLGIAASLSGCAIYDPWQVWRYHVDYNTERACSAQIAFYDHLPPPPVRTRLMQWGYNVGPAGPPATFLIPANAPVCPPAIAPALPPGPATDANSVRPPDLLDRSRPPEVPAAPSPMEAPTGPTARNMSVIQQLNHSVALPTIPPRSTVWMFAPAANRAP